MRGRRSIEGLRLARKKGYRVSKSGTPYGPLGELKPRLYDAKGTKGYYRFSVQGPRDSGKRKTYAVPVHVLQAVHKFGIRKVMKADCVIHMDGDTLNNARYNISLGSWTEVRFSIPAKKRRAMAYNATKRVQRTDWKKIEDAREDGASYGTLEKEFGVPKSSLSYHFSDKAQKRRKRNTAPRTELSRSEAEVFQMWDSLGKAMNAAQQGDTPCA